MLYMVVETYTSGPEPVYERATERGRILPDGLTYLDSWIDERTLARCFQLMETDDPSLFEEWIAAWSDLVDRQATFAGLRVRAALRVMVRLVR